MGNLKDCGPTGALGLGKKMTPIRHLDKPNPAAYNTSKSNPSFQVRIRARTNDLSVQLATKDISIQVE
jgi:hypothetical protein